MPKCADAMLTAARSRARSATTVLGLLVTLLAYTALPAGAAQPHWGPFAEPNPYLGPVGTSTMHGDAGSSDTTPLPGPGTGPLTMTAYPLVSACPTILQGSDLLVVALCTSAVGRVPTVHLIDPEAPTSPFGGSLAQLKLAKGSLLGGVYAFLDNNDRLVAVDGERRLLRIGHSQNPGGDWELTVDSVIDLSGIIPPGDNVTGLTPDWDGNVWFATGKGLVGVVNTVGIAYTYALPAGEQVENSISTSPAGTSVASTHALYQFSFNGAAIQEDWRQEYDRGTARKPGQLSWGTGSTPTYFGSSTGSDFVSIVDNADPQVNLLVYKVDTGEEICNIPVLGSPGGSENSHIGIGDSVFVAGTYGYPYPLLPEGAGPAVPESAPFTGGMTRVDIDPVGCHTVWSQEIRSSAVPHLSTDDGLLYTVVREGSDSTTPLDGFTFAVIDPADGEVLSTKPLPGTIVNDTLQMSGLITEKGDYWQGTVTGILRLRADDHPGTGSSGSADSGSTGSGSTGSGSTG
ncbi:hypothetical protein BFN03_07525 [Rhodococcus sp. WMMA185]|uniref:hypothetical protein n=1 Tax=Rhodococcus sp. WMMA185 TaxID=679318 RepID=UPI000878F8D0|nr:hypothetical protein [Rhodococcus sp. WMMA185]AOW92597.1 hypothetical protein BFN03_07525 [Rhodococcus sp. WMMA185]